MLYCAYMKKAHLIILYALIIALIVAVIYYRESRHLVGPGKVTTPGLINNFADCAAAGLPIQESYPARCVGPDGRTFVQPVPPPDELSPSSDNELSDIIQISSPRTNDIVANPLIIKGQARGNWYFEASFPARLEDANGQVLAQGPVMASGEWMTEDFVPFSASLGYTNPTTTTGRLVLEKDNPSGLEKNARQIIIPIRFE